MANNCKILLVNISELKAEHDTDFPIVAPIGLFYINGYLKSLGYKTKIMQVISAKDKKNMLEDEMYQNELRKEFILFEADYVCFSLRNLTHIGIGESNDNIINSFSVSLDRVVIDFFRKFSSVPFIAGGSGFSIDPKIYMEFMNIDYGIVGEGEIALDTLISCLENKADYRQIPGLVYRQNNNVIVNQNLFVDSLHNMPPMDTGDMAEFNELYLPIGHYASIQTKRGCSFDCVYCSYPWLEGRSYRMRNISTVISEIRDIKIRYAAEHFFIVDSVFSTPVDFSVEFCKALIESELGISWTAYINPRGLSAKVLDYYKRSGCSKLILTTDALSEKMLEQYRKGFTMEDVKICIGLLKQSDIPFEVHVILGGYGEDNKTVNEAIMFCERYLSDIDVFFQLGVVFYLCPAAREALKDDVYFKRVIDSDSLVDILRNNDYNEIKNYTFFFDDIIENRDQAIYEIMYKVISGRRKIFTDNESTTKMVNRIVKQKILKGEL